MKIPGVSLLVCLLLSLQPAGAQDPTPVIHVDHPANTAAAQSSHYVVLVSLDGFGSDYIARFGAPQLTALGTAGAVAAEGMFPSYPSLTFPNHYTLVTGLYPEHHGIVGNSFYDPARGETYSYKDDTTAHDGSWYGGVPLWSLAEQHGMRTAALFWPGSEAEIAGERPTYYEHFDDALDDRKRIDQVIAWLKLPAAQRPHLILVYYSNVDHAGHDFGPESSQARDAVHHVDDLMGEMWRRVSELKLPVDLVVLADHGMATVQPPAIVLNQLSDLNDVHTEGNLMYAKDDAAAAEEYRELKEQAGARYDVYRRADLPAHLHFNENARAGDPVVVARGPFHIDSEPPKKLLPGNHGWDPRIVPQMRAIFFAAGPDIRRGVKLPVFENVDVYPLVARMLRLAAPPTDGRLDPVVPALVRSARAPQ